MRRDELHALAGKRASSHPKQTGLSGAHGPIAPFAPPSPPFHGKGGREGFQWPRAQWRPHCGRSPHSSGAIQRGFAGHLRADAARAVMRDVSRHTIPVGNSRRHVRQNEATREMRNGTQMRDEARCHRDDSRLVTCRSRRAPFRRGMLLEVSYGDSNAASIAPDCPRPVCPEMASEVSLNPPPAPPLGKGGELARVPPDIPSVSGRGLARVRNSAPISSLHPLQPLPAPPSGEGGERVYARVGDQDDSKELRRDLARP